MVARGRRHITSGSQLLRIYIRRKCSERGADDTLLRYQCSNCCYIPFRSSAYSQLPKSQVWMFLLTLLADIGASPSYFDEMLVSPTHDAWLMTRYYSPPWPVSLHTFRWSLKWSCIGELEATLVGSVSWGDNRGGSVTVGWLCLKVDVLIRAAPSQRPAHFSDPDI